MLDVPKLGLEWLNGATTHIAREYEDPDEYDAAIEVLDTARKLVGRTELRRAIHSTSRDAADMQKREKDVMMALTEASEVRRMF